MCWNIYRRHWEKNNILWGRFHEEYATDHRIWWHEIFPIKDKNLKLKYDWFVVVRNPYERLISEFYCKWGGLGKFDNINDIDEKKFNYYIKMRIIHRDPNGSHYTEQHKYIWEHKRMNLHILHF